MYLKAISTAYSALSALSSVVRTQGGRPTTAADSVDNAPAAAPVAVSRPGMIDRISLVFNRDSVARDTANFADTLRQKLAARGVDLSDAPVLTIDDEGKSRVANNHRDKDKIESVLAEDRTLQQQFATISAQSSVLRAFDSQEVFAADFARAGNDATAYSGVVERQAAYSRAKFGLSVDATGYAPVFSMNMRA